TWTPTRSRTHITASACPDLVAATTFSPSLRPTSSTAPKVCGRLCTSAHTTAMVVASIHCEVTVGPVGGHISVGGGATLLSSHAGRSFTPDADKTHERQPESGTHATSQTPGAQDPTAATRGNLTLTLTARYLSVGILLTGGEK